MSPSSAPGNLGAITRASIAKLAGAELVGVYDKNQPMRAAQVAPEFQTQAFSPADELRASCDAVSVAVPTVAHAEVGCRLLEIGLDVLVEKPMAANLAEADALLARGEEIRSASCRSATSNDSIPRSLAVEPILNRPLFFEVHRLGVFTRAASTWMWFTT